MDKINKINSRNLTVFPVHHLKKTPGKENGMILIVMKNQKRMRKPDEKRW